MKREGQLTSIALIKDEAMQIELILEEKKKKSHIGTNGNGSSTVLVNQIENEDQNNIDAIRQTGYKGQNYNPNHQTNKNSIGSNGSNGPAKCAHCKKPGHNVEKCFTKFPHLRPQNNQRQNNSNEGASAGGKRVCKFCDKEGHTAEKCFALEKLEKKIKSAKSRVNEVQEGHGQTENSNNSKN